MKPNSLYGSIVEWSPWQNTREVIKLSCMKKMISTNKTLTYMVMCTAGVMLSIAATKMLIGHCCCTESLKSKAKRALKSVEEKMM